MAKQESKKKKQSATKRNISKEDAQQNRYPNSTVPGVHRDSAPIGGG